MFEKMYENTLINTDLNDPVDTLGLRLKGYPQDQSRIQENLTASQSNNKSNKLYYEQQGKHL